MNANVTFASAPGVLTAALSGEIDHHTATLLRKKIDDKLTQQMPELLILDFTGVGFMDSSGVGLILGRARLTDALGSRLRVQGAGLQVNRMLKLAKIETDTEKEG